MTGGVFISYRREDSGGYAGRIFDRLVSRLGRENVFFDVDAIPLGRDFVEVLTENIGRCDALLAVIGKNWTTIADAEKRRRLDDPRDFVRIEVEAALSRNVPVIPVLVDGAKMPLAEDLPEGLKALPRRQAIEISLARFDTDAECLTDALAALEDNARRREPALASESTLGTAATRPALAVVSKGVETRIAALAASILLAGGAAAIFFARGGDERAPAAVTQTLPPPSAAAPVLTSPSAGRSAKLVTEAAASICARGKGNDGSPEGTALGRLGDLVGDIAGAEPAATPALGPEALRALARDAAAIALRGGPDCASAVSNRIETAFAAARASSVTVKAGDCGIASGGNATGNSVVCSGASGAKPK
jgi:hypothetical protein